MPAKERERGISEEVLHKVLAILDDIYVGEVTLIIQDYRLLQIDRIEKIRLHQGRLRKSGEVEMARDVLAKRISEAVDDLAYGRVAIIVKEGKVLQIERTEKQRL